ncbi:MAG: Dyp-type peroxidase [Microthrixaceae bacterium]
MRPQSGIFALGSRAQHHLELDLRPGTDPAALRSVLAELGETEVSGGATNVVIGFGSTLWGRLVSGPEAVGPVPRGVGPFVEVVGAGGHVAAATQHDMWIWVHGSGPDVVLDTVRAVLGATDGVLSVATDVSCFVYHDSRDLTGFVDGTANAAPVQAPDVALVPDGEIGAGGSHVIVQRWIHDLASFDALDVADQELVFGRTKCDNVELDESVKPANSHIARAEIHDADGEEREIYRRSAPFGVGSEQGLMFLGFSADRDRFDEMLARMYDTAGTGMQDRLLGFTRAVSGAYYFAPSIEELAAVSS